MVIMMVTVVDSILVRGLVPAAGIAPHLVAAGTVPVPHPVAADIDFCITQDFQKPVDLINRLFLFTSFSLPCTTGKKFPAI
jgi:hypothetical protein